MACNTVRCKLIVDPDRKSKLQKLNKIENNEKVTNKMSRNSKIKITTNKNMRAFN